MTETKSTTRKVLALLLLCLGTIVFFNSSDRYVVIGPELLSNNRFQEQLDHWQHPDPGISVPQPGAGIVVIHSDNPDAILSLTQIISPLDSFELLRLSCDLKSDNIPPGNTTWNVARVLLVPIDRTGELMYSRPNLMTALDGRHDWEHREGVFPVYSDATKVSLSVELAQATGTLWVRNLSLRPLAERSSFREYRGIAIALWLLATLWIVAPAVKSAVGNTHRSLILALALAVAVGVLMPESVKDYLGRTLFPALAKVTGGFASYGTFQFLPLLRMPDIYKMGHFLLFALLAAVSLHKKPYDMPRIGMIACLILFAFVTEVLQLFVPGRTALLSDVIVDSAGIATGLALLRIARIRSD